MAKKLTAPFRTERVAPSAPTCEPVEHAHVPLRVVVDPEALQRAAEIFRALGDPARLRILTLLMAGPRCVTELATDLQDNLPAVSQRLKLLKSERIVSNRRQGKHIYYALLDEHIGQLVMTGLSHAVEAIPGIHRSSPRASPG
jgi:ArsR family transcriptional regulator, lead/cadmium/zinc/bismuth-responsive transcriptional repressor